MDYPGNFHNDVITVGAITSTGARSSFSGYGTKLDVVAPGSAILLLGNYDPYATPTYVTNSTQTDSGTSFAAPHVTGIVALMLSANPNLTRCQVANIIESTAQKVGGYSYTTTGGRTNGTWNNQMGYGLVDAYAAVLAAQSTSGGLPVISGASLVCTNQTYTLNNAPGSSKTWSSSYASGLSINSSTGQATRNNSHSGSVTITANINTSGCSSYAKKTIWVGSPLISNAILDGTTSVYSSTPSYICPGSHWITVSPIGTGASNATWTVQNGVPYTVSPNYLDFYMYSNTSSIAITARSSNTCGVGPNFAFYLPKKTWGCPYSFAITVYPNPASDEITIETINTLPEEEQLPAIDYAVILDDMGVTLSTGTAAVDGKTKLDVKGIKKGIYYLQMKVGNEIHKEQILIE